MELLLDHDHDISDAPTALLEYLLTVSHVYKAPAGFLLEKANIDMPLTKDMLMQAGWQLEGGTILHIVASKPLLSWLVPLLGKKGANANVKNWSGKTPLDTAIDSGEEYIARNGQLDYVLRHLRALQRIGAKTTYTTDYVRLRADLSMKGCLRSNPDWLAKHVASRHGLTLKTPFCFHVTGKCPRTSCAK